MPVYDLKFGRIRERESGAEIAEAAFVLPLVFMFLFGMVWFGRAFNIYTTITSAAREGARTAEQCGTVVSFQYQWGIDVPFPSYPYYSRRQIRLSAEAESRMQN